MSDQPNRNPTQIHIKEFIIKPTMKYNPTQYISAAIKHNKIFKMIGMHRHSQRIRWLCKGRRFQAPPLRWSLGFHGCPAMAPLNRPAPEKMARRVPLLAWRCFFFSHHGCHEFCTSVAGVIVPHLVKAYSQLSPGLNNQDHEENCKRQCSMRSK